MKLHIDAHTTFNIKMNTTELISSLRYKKEKVGNGYPESTIVDRR